MGRSVLIPTQRSDQKQANPEPELLSSGKGEANPVHYALKDSLAKSGLTLGIC